MFDGYSLAHAACTNALGYSFLGARLCFEVFVVFLLFGGFFVCFLFFFFFKLYGAPVSPSIPPLEAPVNGNILTVSPQSDIIHKPAEGTFCPTV